MQHVTLGSAHNEFGYNEHPAITNRFLYIKIIDCNVKKFGYNEHPLITSSFFCIFLLIASGTHCKLDAFFLINFRIRLKSTTLLRNAFAESTHNNELFRGIHFGKTWLFKSSLSIELSCGISE